MAAEIRAWAANMFTLENYQQQAQQTINQLTSQIQQKEALDPSEFADGRPDRPRTLFEKIADTVWGFLDGVTGGFTRDLRHGLAWAWSVDESSAYYLGGHVPVRPCCWPCTLCPA